ncbi:MAG: hypothetical protein A3A97_03490 [Candidatus Terrybacteria bacterium RIFCSPLOWO2_01_FULL_40_23]|uniref:Uncharacterized protein n=1 Tax=Candidatus Terrybacteria bacterium RIFCSPLOWO2_01_FULL_40_23 TaxID=1802366 RepID=A0A1G2PPY4_9BACT|nr:MAG: hypothetical protein A3A97_03490 [Candidatus Terrybacteria bacterium RIFCSPLOWO2_01_FULL_40_23]
MKKRYRKNSKSPLFAAYSFAGYNVAYAAKGLSRGIFDKRTYQSFWLSAFLILLVFLSSLGWYVFAVSARVGEDYKLQRLEKKIQGLNEEHNNLVVRLSQEKTLDKIEERALTLGLVPSFKASYVALPSSAVAFSQDADTAR